MFEDIGRSIESLARILRFLGIIGSVIASISMFITASEMRYGGEVYTILGIVILIGGSIVTWISTFLLYAFGELVDKVCDIQKDVKDIKKTATLTLATIEEYTIEEKPTEQNDNSSHEWVCPKCGSVISSFTCEACGYDPSLKANFPVRVFKDNDGKITCPSCKTKQDGNRYSCVTCGQVFINKQPNIPYWCGKCGKEGPFEGSCPSCGSTIKMMNN